MANGKAINSKETLSDILSWEMPDQVKWLVKQFFYHIQFHESIAKNLWLVAISVLTAASLVINIYSGSKNITNYKKLETKIQAIENASAK